jgi:hypothetical protein
MSTFPIQESRWLGIEAKRENLPVLIRLRMFDSPVTHHPELFVITWRYSSDSRTQLPPLAFYNELENFERVTVDAAERRQLGLLVAVETGLGVMRQFYYSKNAEELAVELDAGLPPDVGIEFWSDRDPEWREYHRLVNMINHN